MEVSSAELLQATLAGIVSFISPCVLPLIPAYISYITGETLINMKEGKVSSIKLLVNSIAFVLGFSLVFIIMGASATYIGKFLSRNKLLFESIAGAIIILFGLHTANIINFRFLSYEKKLKVDTKAPSIFKAFLLGFAFSFGWTPCVGPILGTILIQAGTHETVVQGIILLVAYSLGMGIPFVLTALAINKFFEIFASLRKFFGQIEMFAGLLIIGVGLALIFHTGLHSNYLISIILATIGFTILSTQKITISTIVGIVAIFASILITSEIKFLENNYLNKTLVAFVIFLTASIISMWKVGNKNERIEKT